MGPMSFVQRVALVARFAARDLRGGLRGLRIFLACVIVGVAAITGVGALSQSLLGAFAAQGRVMLGGDLSFGRSQRALADDERQALSALGGVSEVAALRGMASAASDRVATVEIKAVDSAWPLVGEAKIEPEQPLASALAASAEGYGALPDATLMERLSLNVGDVFSIGQAKFVVRGRLLQEPDRMATGVGFGPRVIVSTEGLNASGLRTSTSLIRWISRVSGARFMSEAQVQGAAAQILARFPNSGWEARTRANVSPQLTRNVERFSQFMSLIGVVSLIVGGVGIAGAVSAFVDRKRESIAILKTLGASGATVFFVILTEMMAIALLGAIIGALLGAATPFLVSALAGPLLELPFEPVFSLPAMATGVAIGLLTALAFIVAPAGRAHDAPVASLFRLAASVATARLRPVYLVAAAFCFLMLVALVYALTSEKRIAVYAILGVLASALALRAVAWVIALAAAHAPQMRNLPLRLAIGNLHRPNAVTTPVVTSLGLGLALLVAIVSVDGNIRRQLNAGEPGRTPDFFFVDVQSSQAEAFRQFLKERRPGDTVEQVPMLRGRIVRVGERRSEDVRADENAAWALEGDRGVTYAATPPAGSEIVAGQWWAADYKGPPLVSMEQEIARGLQLKVGDEIAVNVAGRTITARIVNLRRVDWRSFGINFVLVFSPATFAGAPHTELVALTSPRGNARLDGPLVREIARAFPNVTTLSVREALDQVLAMVEKLSAAIRAASAVTLTTALLVLGGALAAGQRARLMDAVILRTLGATRRRLIAAYLAEFLMLGAATAAFALLAGMAAAWAIVTTLMKLDFTANWPGMATIIAIGCATTIGLGLTATWRVLGEKPARVLREL